MTLPTASVVVPTFGRPAVRQCVEALLAQTLPDLEILVVDDGGTPAAADTLAGIDDPRLRVLRQDNAGPAAARNRGAAEARADLLAFTDDDCRPAGDWLAKLHAAWQQTPDAMVGGWTVNALPRNGFSEASQVVVDFMYERLNADADDAAFVTSNNMALSRDAFTAQGGFDASYPLAAGEDREWCRRWRAAGHKIRLVREARVDHYHHLTLPKLWRQHVGYGRGGRHFRDTAAGSDDGAFRFPRDHVGLVLRPLPHRPVVSMLLGLVQVATAFGTLSAGRSRKGE